MFPCATFIVQRDYPQVRWTHWEDLVMALAYRSEGEPVEVMEWFRTGVAGPCDWVCPEGDLDDFADVPDLLLVGPS